MKELRERLAEFAHNEQWSGWMKYFFSKCDEAYEDGSIYVPREYAEALQRQVNTPYADLSEEEKDSDRAEADRILDILSENMLNREEITTLQIAIECILSEYNHLDEEMKEYRDLQDKLDKFKSLTDG